MGKTAMLILNGQFDSITYPWWAKETQGNISGSFYIMIPGATHSIAGNHGVCVDDISIQYLSNPSQAPDTACLLDLEIQFVQP